MSGSGISHEGRTGYADAASATGWLSTVVYRSRAVTPLAEIDLQHLVDAAQRRNHAEGITGLVIYDDGRFLQWLEGPADSLSRVMKSINCDARHTDIEVLGTQQTPKRMFGDWDMQLAKKRTGSTSASAGLIDAPPELIETLHKNPETAPSLLANVGKAVLPRFHIVRRAAESAHKYGAAEAPHCVIEPRPMVLARLLLSIAPEPALNFVEEEAARVHEPSSLFRDLFEPAARCLGDLWNIDQCNEFEVTLALCNLQTAMRRTCAKHMAHRLARDLFRKVLVAPQPGESHIFGATMHAEALWHSGWQTRCEFPDTDRALQDLVSSEWFDAIDLSLSESFNRDSRSDHMKRSICATREATLNPNLIVSVSGRMFFERGWSAARVGGDVASSTAFDISGLLENAIRSRKSADAQPGLELNRYRQRNISMN